MSLNFTFVHLCLCALCVCIRLFVCMFDSVREATKYNFASYQLLHSNYTAKNGLVDPGRKSHEEQVLDI